MQRLGAQFAITQEGTKPLRIRPQLDIGRHTNLWMFQFAGCIMWYEVQMRMGETTAKGNITRVDGC